MGIKIRDDNNIPDLIQNLSGLKNRNIEAGVLEDGEQAMIAHVHEYGISITVTPRMRAYLHYMDIHLREDTTSINIPERSFIRSTADQEMGKVYEKISNLLPEVVDNNMDAETFLEMIGLELEGKIKDKIVEISDPPNSDVTVEQKGSSNPLVDTGGLVASISHRAK